MKSIFTLIVALLATYSFAQTCTIDYSQNTPGLYPGTMPAATIGSSYDEEVTVLFPMSEAGVNYTSFKIVSTELPLGLTWKCSNESNGCVYTVQQDPFACLTISGTPAEYGSFEMKINAIATASNGATSAYTLTADLIVGEATTTNSLFTFSPNFGCENAQVNFALTNPVNYTPIPGQTTGITYNWDFGNGFASAQATPPAQTYNTVGEYEVSLTQFVDTIGFRLKNVVINTVGCDDALTYGNPDIYIHILDADNVIVHSTEASPNDANLPQTYNLNVLLNNPPYSIRVMDDDSDNLWGTDDDNCINSSENGNTTALVLPSVNSYGSTMQIGNNQSLNFTYTIEKDVSETVITETVSVYENPATPLITMNGTPEEVYSLLTEDLGHVYHWFFNDERMYEFNGTEALTPNNGDYAVMAVSEHGCYSTSDVFEVTGNASIDEVKANGFKLYPNPTTDALNIEFMDAVTGELMIYDLSGRVVFTQNINGVNNLQVDVNSLSKGVYTISTIQNDGAISTNKLIVQ